MGRLAARMAAAHHDDVEHVSRETPPHLPDAEARENLAEYILHPDAAHKGVELAQGAAEGFRGDLDRGAGR
jgi:hypothetical protein